MIFRDLKGLQSTLHMDRLLEMLDEVHFVEEFVGLRRL